VSGEDEYLFDRDSFVSYRILASFNNGNVNMNSILLGYVGPDTVLPVASAFAAVLGAVLLFAKSIWRYIVNLFRRFRKPAQVTKGETSGAGVCPAPSALSRSSGF